MPCHFCRFFREDAPINYKSGVIESIASHRGQCTRQSEWRPVTGFHYCGDLSLKDPSIAGHWRMRLDEIGEDLRWEKDKRIAAEKKLKLLRAKARGKRESV